MKVSDYIIQFLMEKQVTDVFGYPGGAINHLADSAAKCPEIEAHLNYHEQGAAFAACGYAQAGGKLGVAYSTSGPGATNLVTGIANAYFDSIPVLFITGQVDSYTTKGSLPIRQRGFQETDVLSIVSGITKWAVSVEKPEHIRYSLERAYHAAVEGNPGPVVLDIPNDVQRAEVDIDALEGYQAPKEKDTEGDDRSTAVQVLTMLQKASRPLLLLGNGVKQAGLAADMREIVERLNIPVVFSLPALDLLPYDHPLNYGFIGTNGHRYANLLTEKCDLLVVIGARMDVRQIGAAREQFASNAKLLRIDVDRGQLEYSVRDDEITFCRDLKTFLPDLRTMLETEYVEQPQNKRWNKVCQEIRAQLRGFDDIFPCRLVTAISKKTPDGAQVTADVGQNLLWVAQSFHINEGKKKGQHLFMSAGHGAMGYSLAAAIGVYYATHKPVLSFNGDGGLMMNLQELQFIKREKLPISVIVFNNSSLGMIRAWQERYMERFAQTTEDSGYLAADFAKIAAAFDFPCFAVKTVEDLEHWRADMNGPVLIELIIPEGEQTCPRDRLQDQNPPLDRALYKRLLEL